MIAVIADIHGNLPALQAVLSEADKLNCTRIVSLGDVVGYYAQPKECIESLAERQVLNIMGNHDYYLVSGSACPRSKLVAEITEFHRKIVSPKHIEWLSRSVSELREGDRYFVHGGWTDPMDQYLYRVNLNDMPKTARWFFSGHTHVQTLLEGGGKIYCNPGSVGQPRDGDPRAAFAVITDSGIDLHRVPYDIDQTAFQMRKAGFSEFYYENLYIGAQIGGRIDKVTLIGN